MLGTTGGFRINTTTPWIDASIILKRQLNWLQTAPLSANHKYIPKDCLNFLLSQTDNFVCVWSPIGYFVLSITIELSSSLLESSKEASIYVWVPLPAHKMTSRRLPLAFRKNQLPCCDVPADPWLFLGFRYNSHAFETLGKPVLLIFIMHRTMNS